MKYANIFAGIGVGLGMVCGVPLLFFIANTFFYKGNNAVDVIPLYMHNVREMKVTIPERKFRNPNSLLSYKDTSYVSYLKKNGNGDLFKIVFYDIYHKKYFEIKLFDYGGRDKNYFLPEVLEKKEVLITVNNADFNNSNYGSKKNPVPVFKYRGLSPIKFGDFDYDISPSEFKYNVTQYLTYLMPKDEFKKRFGK